MYDIIVSVPIQCFRRRRMSKITNYDEASKSHDFVKEHDDTYIIKSMMEHFTGKNLKVMKN